MLKDFVEIGKLGKPFGTNGKIKLTCEEEIFSVLNSKKVFFLKRGGHYIPYFVQYLEDSHDYLLKIEDFDDPQAVKSCSGERLYLPLKDLPKLKEKPGLYFSVIKEFTLFDQNNIKVGTIEDIVSMPQQELAQISLPNGDQVLIPLHESLIIDLDPDTKTLTLEVAEGLLDI